MMNLFSGLKLSNTHKAKVAEALPPSAPGTAIDAAGTAFAEKPGLAERAVRGTTAVLEARTELDAKAAAKLLPKSEYEKDAEKHKEAINATLRDLQKKHAKAIKEYKVDKINSKVRLAAVEFEDQFRKGATEARDEVFKRQADAIAYITELGEEQEFVKQLPEGQRFLGILGVLKSGGSMKEAFALFEEQVKMLYVAADEAQLVQAKENVSAACTQVMNIDRKLKDDLRPSAEEIIKQIAHRADYEKGGESKTGSAKWIELTIKVLGKFGHAVVKVGAAAAQADPTRLATLAAGPGAAFADAGINQLERMGQAANRHAHYDKMKTLDELLAAYDPKDIAQTIVTRQESVVDADCDILVAPVVGLIPIPFVPSIIDDIIRGTLKSFFRSRLKVLEDTLEEGAPKPQQPAGEAPDPEKLAENAQKVTDGALATEATTLASKAKQAFNAKKAELQENISKEANEIKENPKEWLQKIARAIIAKAADLAGVALDFALEGVETLLGLVEKLASLIIDLFMDLFTKLIAKVQKSAQAVTKEELKGIVSKFKEFSDAGITQVTIS